MGTAVDDLAAKVAAYTTVETSVIALLSDLSTRLKSAIASGDPTQLESLVKQIDENNAALAAAVTANTVPVAPAPAPSVNTASPASGTSTVTSAESVSTVEVKS